MQSQVIPLLARTLRTSRSILLGALLSAIVAVIITTWLSANHLKQQAQMRTEVATQNLVRSLEQNVFEMVRSVDVALLNTADEIGNQVASGGVNAANISEFIRRQLLRQPHIAYIRATNERGDVVYGPGVLTPANNVADRDYFTQLRDDPRGDVLVQKVLLGRIEGKWVWLFVRPVHTPDGTFGGVVFAGVLVDKLSQDFSRYQLDSGGLIALRDGAMGLIARHVVGPSATLKPGDKSVSAPFIKALGTDAAAGTYVSGETSIDGISRVHSYRRNAQYDFVVNVGISGQVEHQQWLRQAYLGTALVVAFIVAASAFAWLLLGSWKNHEKNLASVLAGQEALSHSEERFRSLFASMSEGVALHRVVADDTGRAIDYVIVEVNPAFVSQTGIARERVVGKRASVAYGVPEAPFLERYAEVARTQQPIAFEQRFEPLQKDFVIHVFSPAPGQFATVFEDITERKNLARELHEREAFVLGVMDSLAEHMAVISRDGTIIAVNAAWREFAQGNGVTDASAVGVGSNYLHICADAGDDPIAKAAKEGILAVVNGKQNEFSTIYPCHGPGVDRWFQMRVLPLWDATRGALVIHQNITARYVLEQRIRESEARYRLLAENISDVIWVLDLRTRRFTYVSPSVRALRGYSPEEVMAQSMDQTMTPESLALVRSKIQALQTTLAAGERRSGTELTEVEQPHRDGHIVHTEVVTSYLLDEQGQASEILGVSRDIGERKRLQAEQQQAHQKLEAQFKEISELQERLLMQVLRDPLTGLHNRRYMDETLPRELARAKREGYALSLIMLDLDYFKRVNDTYGHAVGDVVLISLAQLLKANAREGDIICRYGGEEFLVAMSHMTPEQARVRLNAWRQDIADTVVQHGDLQIRVTLSAGVAGFPDHGADMDVLLNRADAALYQAKDEGRNRVVVAQMPKLPS